MARKKASVGLVAFLKGSTNPKKEMPGCANYDHRYGGCLFNDECTVERGSRCAYFESAVLPTADDIGLKEAVYAAYEKQVDIVNNGGLEREPIRLCPDCGAELKPRQRYCDMCGKRRRRQSYRKTRRQTGRCATVNKNCPQNIAV